MSKDPLFWMMCLLQGKTDVPRELFENDQALRQMITEGKPITSLMIHIWTTYEGMVV